jgi:regulator of sigma E protease
MENQHDTYEDPSNEQLSSPSFLNERPNNGDSWVKRNGLWLVLLVSAFSYFMTQFNALSVIMVVVGISLLIFVHELGHFLVAKWCNVHVQTFSIGLGPAIPGCSFRWGETTYKIGFIPLGGYVKMVGEGADEADGNDDPRSFKNKSVGQRMAIISAGVTMNIIFGFACFVYVYMAHGEERFPAVIDSTEVGSAAWQNGIHTGDVVHQIGNKRDPYWDDFVFQVMNSVKGEKLDLVLGSPGTSEQNWTRLKIEPQRRDEDPKPIIGVQFALDLKLWPAQFKKIRRFPVKQESAASEANPPFEFGDEILGTTDPAEPENLEKILPLPVDPRTPGDPNHLDYFEFRRRLLLLAGRPMVIQVRRAGSSQIENIQVPAEFHYVVPGLIMEMGEIVALRNDSPALRAGVQVKDIIEQVLLKDGSNHTLRYTTKPQGHGAGVDEKALDPTRLPYELDRWAANQPGNRQVVLVVRRGSSTQTLTLDWDDRWDFNHEPATPPRWSMSLASLGIAYQVNTRVADVVPGSHAANLGFRTNDVVRACRYMRFGKKLTDPPEPDSWTDLKPNGWAEVFTSFQDNHIKQLTLRLSRENIEIEVRPERDTSWPSDDRGLALMPEIRLVKAETVGQALAMGCGRTWDFVSGIYGNLRSLATSRVSPNLMSGPISVAETAYAVADEDSYKYILFLAIISINLAIVNFLPIPVLDGGHMMFLIYEKLCRRPASRQIRVATTYLGLALIVSLMVFVIYLDLKRKLT